MGLSTSHQSLELLAVLDVLQSAVYRAQLSLLPRPIFSDLFFVPLALLERIPHLPHRRLYRYPEAAAEISRHSMLLSEKTHLPDNGHIICVIVKCFDSAVEPRSDLFAVISASGWSGKRGDEQLPRLTLCPTALRIFGRIARLDRQVGQTN